MLDFSRFIINEMAKKNYSVNNLALRADVTPCSLSCWINGSVPNVRSLEKVLDKLGYELKIVEKRKKGKNESGSI